VTLIYEKVGGAGFFQNVGDGNFFGENTKKGYF